MPGALGLLLANAGTPGVINPSIPGASNPAGVSWSLVNDGTYSHTGPTSGNWVTPANATVAARYQVKVDVTAGSLSSGTLGTWLDLSSTRTWTANAGSSAFVTVTIREKLSGVVRSTQTNVQIDAA